MKKLFLVITYTLLMAMSFSSISEAVVFYDIKGNWAEATINNMASMNLIGGYSDGSFKPDDQVNRAEFTAMMNQVFNKYDESANSKFIDVLPSDWFYKQVASGYKAGYIAGLPGNMFKPYDFVTREQAAVMITKILNISGVTTDTKVSFSDSDKIAYWSKESIALLVGKGIIGGYPDGSFKPQATLTRAEAVVMLQGAMQTDKLNVKPIEIQPKAGLLPEQNQQIQSNSGIYNLTYFNTFVKNFSISGSIFENANYYNIIGTTLDKKTIVKLSENAVSINEEIKIVDGMLTNKDKLMIEFYSDAAGTNIVGRGKLGETNITIENIKANTPAYGSITASK